MKFEETLLFRVLMIPVYFAKENCLYRGVLAIPALVLVLIIGIIIAVIVDVSNASFDVIT